MRLTKSPHASSTPSTTFLSPDLTPLFGPKLELKTPAQIAIMRRAGLVVGETLELLRSQVRPGITTGELDAIAEDAIRAAGATPSFLGYQGFPASICTSVNDEVVHGIPGTRALVEGDLISIDCGAIVDGWHGDAALTVAVGAITPQAQALMHVTRESMWRGLAAATVGGRVGDISRAVSSYVESAGDYGIVEDYTGHGIGTAMHLDPDVPNYVTGRRTPRMDLGLALAVEPMITLGSQQTTVLGDDWTVVTRDGSWSAHFEHTFALTDRGVWVLTALDGGQADLERLGVPFGGA